MIGETAPSIEKPIHKPPAISLQHHRKSAWFWWSGHNFGKFSYEMNGKRICKIVSMMRLVSYRYETVQQCLHRFTAPPKIDPTQITSQLHNRYFEVNRESLKNWRDHVHHLWFQSYMTGKRFNTLRCVTLIRICGISLGECGFNKNKRWFFFAHNFANFHFIRFYHFSFDKIWEQFKMQ